MKTLYDKIWDRHLVHAEAGKPSLLYIDLHLIHEVTSPQAFEGLRLAGRKLRRPELTFGTIDHAIPTINRNLPIVNFGDFPAWGGSGFNGSENPVYSFNDDLSWTRGKHIFKMGYLFEFAPYVGLGQQAGAGNITFNTALTALPAQSNRNLGGGVGFASFLLGEASNATIHTPRRVGMRWRYHAMYFQDDWRITPRLTLNLGMRYEFNLPAYNDSDQCADFDPTYPTSSRIVFGSIRWIFRFHCCTSPTPRICP